MSKNIAEYVAAARKGDQSAFSALFEMASQKAYYTAFKITKNQHDAEDMVQDAFIKAFTSLDSLADDRKFESWLNMIVANKCRDCLKKKRPDLFSKYDNDDSDIAFEDTLENSDISLLPQSVTENKATKDLVMSCIDKLPDEQRACVVMFYYDELSVKDIATALDIPVGTVKSRLNKARKTLKAEFEEIEKKDKIKLHGVPFAPLIRWVFQKGAESDELPKLAFRRIIKAILEILKDSGKIVTGIQVAGNAAIVKVIAGVLAGVVALTGIGFGVNALLNKDNVEEEITQPVAVVTELTTEPETVLEPYYAEGSLAVKDRDGTVYYISDKGIMKKLPDGDKLISSKVPENLVYEDSLLYLYQGTLYSFDGEKEQELMKADGAMLYETDNSFVSISADRNAVYSINLENKTSEKTSINGSNMQFIDGSIYYYDNSSNLCRSNPQRERKDIVVSTDYTKGFKAAWAVANGTVYFAGFDSDANGTIYASSLSTGNVSKIKLNNDGIRDFTVIGSSIYYSTYNGRFYVSDLDGNSTLITENSFYHLFNSEGYTVWAEMGSNTVYLIQTGSSSLRKTSLPSTMLDFEKVGNTAYYRTNHSHSTYSLGSDGSE